MKNIILKERNTGLLVTADPKEIDLTELAIEIISANNVIVSLGDTYEVVSVKSKKEAETALENIKSTIMKLKVDNEEEKSVTSQESNPNTDKILNVLGKMADLVSPLVNNEALFTFISEYIEDTITNALENIIQNNNESAEEDYNEEEVEEMPKKIPLVTFEEEDYEIAASEDQEQAEVTTVTAELEL